MHFADRQNDCSICTGDVHDMIRLGCTADMVTWRCENCHAAIASPLPEEPICACGWIDKVPAVRQQAGSGVGTELKRIFAAFGFQACETCTDRAQALDEYGIDWCEQNKPVIIQWISEAAHNRWMPAVGVPSIVQMAIDAAKGRR
jgi:hypothetical protein